PVGRPRRIDVRLDGPILARGGYRASSDGLAGRCSRGYSRGPLTIHLLSFASSHMQPDVKRAERQRHVEAAAREAFELRAGRTLTDSEWAAARRRLVEFAQILRSWDRKTIDLSQGKVE
ncbi:MAG TPA: hypothetical protein VEX68_27330, partial [Bryobacteraceae bacterium]|nr:hypothetical protein [Bryobacteraceae bacterium]